MTRILLQCTVEGGESFAVEPDVVAQGFVERGAYTFTAPSGCFLYVDDMPLAASTQSAHTSWQWSPGFYAGQVNVELMAEDGGLLGRYRLDVSAHPEKLGSEQFKAMLDHLFDADPGLLLGNEAGQTRIGEQMAWTDPHLRYARLRRHADGVLAAFRLVSDRPLSRLHRTHDVVPAHRVKRVDSVALRKALMSPNGRALLHPDSLERPPPSRIGLEVRTPYDSYDNPANQALALMLHKLLRRCVQVRGELQRAALSERESSTRSVLAPRIQRRIGYLDGLRARLERTARLPLFANLSQRRLSAAGLNAISAHPAYARAYRLAWQALRPGVTGAGDESLWVSPTWEIYERWCYLVLVERLRARHPQLQWSRSSTARDRICWRGEGLQTTLEIRLQARFPAVDQTPSAGCASLSKERRPDITVILRGPGRTRFVVLDAKYSTSRDVILDAMSSAHIYHDSLRCDDIGPSAAWLLVPHAQQVPVLAQQAFLSRHGVGVQALAEESQADELADRLMNVLQGESL
ncbi:DUF2357 domain-containing protein [Pseudomonas putida]|uniref:DUF2357 domain-containing protein n=1 Tax=Pseudomonas putida TaxID=303 RepID=UPI00383A7426